MIRVKRIVPAKKVDFTKGKIDGLQCDEGKTRTYLWAMDVKGLGVIATTSGSKSFIFQAKINGKSARITIGNVDVWSISDAKVEARRLQVQIDQGNDPREIKKEKETAKKFADIARSQHEIMQSLTFGNAWVEYVNARKPYWSERHYQDHESMVHTGGENRHRSDKLTIPGCLAVLLKVRLKDLTPELLIEWAKKEVNRATQARLAMRLIRAFFNWCMDHSIYKTIIISNPARNKSIREILGKPKTKNDVLQREQLPAWFDAVRQINNPVISAYLQTLILTGARREEITHIQWEDIDFQWNSLTIRDKVDGLRVIPLTPYVSYLLANLPRRNEWVFSSSTAATGRLTEPRLAHNKACAIAGLDLTIHGLRRSFASLSEWIECPAGIAAQIQGHKPQGVREQNYIRRPLDLLRMWHIKIEAWILEQACIKFTPEKAGLKAVATTTQQN